MSNEYDITNNESSDNEEMQKIVFYREGEEVEFYILSQVTIQNKNYILVVDTLDGDADAYILKEISVVDDEVTYEELGDEEELDSIMKVFQENLDDVDIQME